MKNPNHIKMPNKKVKDYLRALSIVKRGQKKIIIRLFLMRIVLNIKILVKLIFTFKLLKLKHIHTNYNNTIDFNYQIRGYFINLKHRTDRLSSIKKELITLGMSNFSRYEAMPNTNGTLGCSLSHFKLLSNWDNANDELLMICEDDIRFNVSSLELLELIQDFVNDPKADVLLLAANTLIHHPYSYYFNIVLNSQTTAAYIVKPHMKNILLENYQLSIDLLEKGILSNIAAIDQIWKDLQVKFTFITPKKTSVYQSESYSDIEKTTVNVGS